MDKKLKMTINGRVIEVAEGSSVAAVLLSAGEASRTSLAGEQRAPFCGMGVCMECRARVDGRPHQRTCQMSCREGMEVESE